MKPAIGVVAAAAAGAAAMYFFDPAAGPQRRAALLRMRGTLHQPALLPAPPGDARRDPQASDAALIAAHEARIAAGVRDLIDGLGDDMGAVAVSVEAGRVRLAGRVAPARRQALIDGVADIVGSRNVVDALEGRPAAPHEAGEGGGHGDAQEAGSGGPGGGIGTGP